MDKFHTHTGIGVPLRASNVDTDQIIPARYLKSVRRTGFEDGLFANWRTDPEFVLNKEPFSRGSVLFAGPDFGTGSSREHASWALKDYGFKAVFSPRFADIFRGNAGKNGLLAGVMDEAAIVEIQDALDAADSVEAAAQVTVNVEDKTVKVGKNTYPFDVDEYTRWRLMEGFDDIGLTLRHDDAIAAFEQHRPGFLPKVG